MPKRSPEQVLEDIENADVDDEIERALAMTPEERRRALAEMGVDGEVLRARADALFERVQGAAGEQVERGVGIGHGERGAGIGHGKLEGGIGHGHGEREAGIGHGHGNGEKQKGEGSGYGVGRGMRRGARIAWVGVALAAGVAVAFFVSSRRDEDVAAGHLPDVVGHGPIAQAALLRKQAYLELRNGHYRACIERLDEARGLDPAGDGDPAVQEARERARRGLSSAPEEGAGAR